MEFFKRLFGNNTPASKKIEAQGVSPLNTNESLDKEILVDELFVKEFIRNGGKFLYTTSVEEAHEAFDNILLEKNWYEQNCLCFEPALYQEFSNYNLNYTQDPQSKTSFLLCGTHYLIANDGALLVTSKQIRDEKIPQLPDSLIVIATTSQIVYSIQEAMKMIKKNKEQALPNNITAFRSFVPTKVKKEQENVLSYGSADKEVYLILIENL